MSYTSFNFKSIFDVCKRHRIFTFLSIKIRLSNVEHIPYHMAAQVSSSLTNIVNVYTRGGLNASVALMDMDF